MNLSLIGGSSPILASFGKIAFSQKTACRSSACGAGWKVGLETAIQMGCHFMNRLKGMDIDTCAQACRMPTPTISLPVGFRESCIPSSVNTFD
jgi:hypothetical protein